MREILFLFFSEERPGFVCFLLGNSPASEFYMPTFRNTLFPLRRQVGMKNDWGWECWGIYKGKFWIENSVSQWLTLFYVPTFRNTLFGSKIALAIGSHYFRSKPFPYKYPNILNPSHSSYLSAYEEGTECSETSAYKSQTPGNYTEESIQHAEQGESLKSWRPGLARIWNNACSFEKCNKIHLGSRGLCTRVCYCIQTGSKLVAALIRSESRKHLEVLGKGFLKLFQNGTVWVYVADAT